MRLQPSINAMNMESMAALWEQPEALVFAEFTKANRAIGEFNQPISSLVLTHRNLTDQSFIKPIRRRDVPRLMLCINNRIPGGVRRRMLAVAVVLLARPKADAVFGDDGVVGDEEEGGG